MIDDFVLDDTSDLGIRLSTASNSPCIEDLISSSLIIIVDDTLLDAACFGDKSVQAFAIGIGDSGFRQDSLNQNHR